MKTACVEYDYAEHRLSCSGEWTTAHLVELERNLIEHLPLAAAEVDIDGSTISAFDTVGAWMVKKIIANLQAHNVLVRVGGFSTPQLDLIELVSIDQVLAKPEVERFLPALGRTVVDQFEESLAFISFIGEMVIIGLCAFTKLNKLDWSNGIYVIEKTGARALPIVGLLSFLIGVVLTYQMGVQLQTYGANIFIVDLLGLAIFREFAPLLTAIIVAGRSGAAFTAEVGIMKIREEIDALKIMGLVPLETIVFPRIWGLIWSIPLLTVWADLFGMLGGMLMSDAMLGVSHHDFIQHAKHAVSLSSFVIGIGKAPVFAGIIASVGCFQGLRVTGSAESIGAQTTKSVVMAIFLIIVADAGFSILLSYFDI